MKLKITSVLNNSYTERQYIGKVFRGNDRILLANEMIQYFIYEDKINGTNLIDRVTMFEYGDNIFTTNIYGSLRYILNNGNELRVYFADEDKLKEKELIAEAKRKQEKYDNRWDAHDEAEQNFYANGGAFD